VKLAARVLLLVPARSYRAAAFLLAAAKMGLDLTVASDGALPLGGRPVITVRPGDPDRAAELIASRCGPVDAVVAADAPMLLLAALVATRLGLPHNPADGVLAASDKTRQRHHWLAAGVPQPRFEVIPADASDDAIRQASAAVGFPCVVKAVSLSASQGVLRADDAGQAMRAASRIRRVLSAVRQHADEPLLAEEYLPGPELSIDGLLTDGRLTPLAVFDKPATPDGPTFEETLLVTPSRLPRHVVAGAIRTAGHAARALGLRTGPVHAELRVTGTSAAMLELAARSIGGLCSRALRFPGGKTLEELILASALGDPPSAHDNEALRPSGVFMLPVPRAGVLRAVEGRTAAEAVPGIVGVTITIPPGRRVRPLPDGDQYLGFIFAEADTPDDVAKALTTASHQLHAVISEE
jgi:biotin carboxylase